MKRTILLLGVLSLMAGGEEEAKVAGGHVFAWPFLEAGEMQPRGGTTQGASVTLDVQPSKQWQDLQKEGTKYEKDVRGILAMAGDYRVSFDFVETMGVRENYTPPRPYFSWGTEHVQVIQFDEDFISLQHTLVMFFKDEDGKESGPFLVKHWRQDWTYEDVDLHRYQGHLTWKRERRKAEEVKGKWTQAVFQVDDSPRYEVVGEWVHADGLSMWKSESCARPLPRREFSVRKDYNVLEGTHEISITPTGWLHVQNNQKLSINDEGGRNYVGQELGVNRYERISAPSLVAAEESWDKTKGYWEDVRKMWEEVYAKRDSFTLKPEVEGRKLYQEHFKFAGEVEESGYEASAGRAHARATILKFLVNSSEGKNGKY
ncbi:DUF6607 family protein [Verrucomicrobiaceae bacterium 227]